MYNTMISLKAKVSIVFFSALLLAFFAMNTSLMASEIISKPVSNTNEVSISDIVAAENNKRINPPPKLKVGWAAETKKKNKNTFFIIGAIINITMMLFFFRWAYREWKK
jgi:hypothetical protein